MNVALNLVPSAVGQTRPQIISAIVANNTTDTPLPTSFADPLYVVSPTDSDSWWKVTDWPASRGVTLPQAGAAVALFYDVKGALRCVWWDGIYKADPIGAPPRARISTSGQVIPSEGSSFTTLPLSFGWDLQNGMADSGNGVEVPIAGYYSLRAQATGPSSVGAGYIQLEFAINGGGGFPSGGGTISMSATTAYPTVTVEYEVLLSARDVVTLIAFNATAAAITLNAVTCFMRYTGQ